MVTKEESWEIPAYSAGRIIDTTGCGDVYLAAYVVKRIAGQSVSDAAQTASAAAALSATTFGAPQITHEDVRSTILGKRIDTSGP